MAKFRSWNKDFKFFIYWEDGEYYYIPDIERINPETKEPYKHVISRRQNTETFNWQNAEQSTGLFDKNGKEIFVGDKVKWKDYDHFGCCFEYKSIVEQEKCGAYITETPDGTGSYYVWGKTDELGVIGHIHEGD